MLRFIQLLCHSKILLIQVVNLGKTLFAGILLLSIFDLLTKGFGQCFEMKI